MAEATYPAVTAIEARLKNGLTAIDPTWTMASNIKWPGQTFQPGDTAHVEVNVLFSGEPEWLTHGLDYGSSLISGIAQFTFRQRPGSGLGAMRERAAVVRALFDRKTITLSTGVEADAYDTHVIEFGPAGAPRPSVGTDAWETLIVDCPFTVEESEVTTP